MNGFEGIYEYKETPNNYYSPTLSKRLLGYSYDLPEKVPKKEKKWSLGNFFRRKKKDDESNSDEEHRKSFLTNKKKKSDSKKKKKIVGRFDHVVIPKNPHLYENTGIFSDPETINYPTYTTRPLTKSEPREVLQVQNLSSNETLGNSSISRKSRKDLAKVRAEARRNNLSCDSTSEEDSVSSIRFRSDENLKQIERSSSFARRSRAARTERYLKRFSRDAENINSYLKSSHSDVGNSNKSQEITSRLSTIPPSHNRVSNSTSNPNYKPPMSLNDYHQITRSTSDLQPHHFSCDSIQSLKQVKSPRQPPPPPPPRDPRRLVTAHYDFMRPNTFYLDKLQSFSPKLHKKLKNSNSRSTSEDYLFKNNISVLPRPSSANDKYAYSNPNAENYNYMMEKSPRSRKPILISKKPKESTMETSPPQLFSCKTSVKNEIFLPSTKTTELDEDLKRKSANLEEALDELEAIYNSLRLGDEDLLDRAEQRENDIAVKKQKETLSLSDSGFSYKTADRKSDDMAFRKLNKKNSLAVKPQSILSRVSYLDSSPVFGSGHNNNNYKSLNEPDIKFDDLVYRNVKFSNQMLQVVEPQPPFGIPLGPIISSPNSDYLHVTADKQRSRFKPRKIPDIVNDDLAFRTLRKDQNKEKVPYLSDDLKNNNTIDTKLDLNTLKKKRAVRSLSANISSLMERNLRNVENEMNIAHQVLKEKENKINLTRKGFLSDSDVGNSNDLIEMNFLKDIQSFKASSEENLKQVNIQSSSLDDLITALTNETTEIEEDKSLKKLNKTLCDIDMVSEQAKHCEKLLEGIVDNVVLEQVEELNNEPGSFVANVITDNSSKIIDSDHDYENLKSYEELDSKETKSISPFEEQKVELIATFQDLKNLDFEEKKDAGERCVGVLDVSRECANSKLGSKVGLSNQAILGNKSMRGISNEHIFDRNRRAASSSWYRDPATLAVACSYGVACFQHLGSLDVVAFVGFLFAVLSLIAALIF